MQLSQTQTSACEAFHSVHVLINFVLNSTACAHPHGICWQGTFLKEHFLGLMLFVHTDNIRLGYITIRIVKVDKLLQMKNIYEVLAIGKCHVCLQLDVHKILESESPL